MSLLDQVYLPDLEKRNIRDSEGYKLLKDNKLDPSILEGYQPEYKDTEIKIQDFDTFINEGGTKEDWIARHVTPENKKAFFGTIGDFLVDTGKDTVLSLGVAAINGADVATNMMPLVAKVLDNSPLATALPNGFMNAETEEQVYNAAKVASENLGKARDYLKSFKEDDNVVSQLIGVIGQDLVYSIPIYNKLKSLGVPNYPAFFLAGGIGGAIGIEDKVLGDDSYFSKSLFAKDIVELKNLVGILPNTPEDKIADEVVQALEYGALSVAIPGIIDAFKFMKRYIPAFAGGAAIATIPGDDAEANPIKAIANAVFKSTAKEAVEQKITKGSGPQIYNTIKNTPGVKETELKWLGLEGFLKDKKNVTQEEVLNFIKENRLDVNERSFGAANIEQGQVKPLKDFSSDEFSKLEDQIFDDIENGIARDEYRYVADHIGYLRQANFQRLDNFGIRKTEYAEGYDAPDITDQNYNMSNYMSDNTLWRSVDGLDDGDGSPIGFDYWNNTFAEFYEVFAIKSKATNQLIDDAIEREFYKKFAEEQMTVPDEMIRNADVNNGFHIQADAFEDFKKYLDDAGLYIGRYNKMEIPKDQRQAVYNETMIRSNEEMYYQNSGDMDSISEALDEYVGGGAERPKYEQYTSGGGEAYSELVFTLSKGGENVGTKFPIETPITKAATIRDFQLRTSPHFNVSGEIAHVRFKTREIPGPRAGVKEGSLKVLSVEEMQSDLVQGTKQFNEVAIDNKRRELIDQNTTTQMERNRFENISEEDVQKMLKDSPPENLVKDFPFKNNWYELVLKRLIRYAADNGFDAISIPKAKVIQDRYNLTRRVDKLHITAYFPERQEIGILGRDQDGITEFDDLYTFEKLKKDFGEDVQKKLINIASKSDLDDALTRSETNYKAMVDGNDEYPSLKLDEVIEIGGQGKSRLYNKTIPSFLKKYGKKWNAKVYDDEINTLTEDAYSLAISAGQNVKLPTMPVTIIEITPEMKKSVQETSQPLFEIFGTVGLSSWMANEVSDSMKNNIISQTTENMY